MSSYGHDMIRRQTTYIPTHLPHLSFPSLQKVRKSESNCSYETENKNLSKKSHRRKKTRNHQQSFEEYISSKLLSFSADSIHYVKTMESKLEKSMSPTLSHSNKQNKNKKNSQRVPYLDLKASIKNATKTELITTEDYENKKMSLPSFITDKTVEYEKQKNREIMERKSRINSFALKIKKLEEKRKKHKSKKPYSKNQDDLIKDAHYVVYELETEQNNLKNINRPINTMKNFAERHRVTEKKIKDEIEKKEIRFPLLFQKILCDSNQFQGPNNHFELFSKTPYNKLIMKNVNQTLRIPKKW